MHFSRLELGSVNNQLDIGSTGAYYWFEQWELITQLYNH